MMIRNAPISSREHHSDHREETRAIQLDTDADWLMPMLRERTSLLLQPNLHRHPLPGGKPNKGNGKPDDAAPVLPQSKAKAHAKGKASPRRIQGVRLLIPREQTDHCDDVREF